MVIGDMIEVIDAKVSPFPMRGKVLELDEHPFKESYALIEVDSPALPAPKEWVNLRLAKKIEGDQ